MISSAFATDEQTIIRYIEKVHAKILQAAELANYSTSDISRTISLNESKEVNANSGITINYGMLNYIQNEDELAGLLGHEVAHNLVGYDEENKTENEYVADKLGSFLAARSGYNPYGLQLLLERIANDPERKDDIDSDEITHPKTSERASKLKQYLQDRSFLNRHKTEDTTYKSVVSLLYDRSRITNNEIRKIIPELNKIQDDIENALYSDDQQLKIKTLNVSLEKLSQIARKNPHLKNYRQIKYRISGYVFLSDILYKAYPDWLKDKDISGAKFHALLKDVGELALSICPFVGDGIDWYELTTGKSFFTGENLSYTSQLFAGAGIILGSRQIYEGASSIAERIIRDFPGLNSETQNTIRKIGNTFDNAKIESSESINNNLKKYYPVPPFMTNSPVIVRTTNTNEEFVRFISDDNRINGNWIVRKEEIIGMSPEKVADYLSMPTIPKKIVDVKLPKGVDVVEGVSAPAFGKHGGGWQVYIDSALPSKEWFGPVNDL